MDQNDEPRNPPDKIEILQVDTHTISQNEAMCKILSKYATSDNNAHKK